MSDIISHAREIPYWELKGMRSALDACHQLYNKVNPTWDQLYMLRVMSYGQLQRGYHD